MSSFILEIQIESYNELAATWITRVVDAWSQSCTTVTVALRIETTITSDCEYVVSCYIEAQAVDAGLACEGSWDGVTQRQCVETQE